MAVVAALIESPTTRKGLESKGLVSSAEKRDEAEVAFQQCAMLEMLSALKRSTFDGFSGCYPNSTWLSLR